MTGADYWAEALTWERTPFDWQSAAKGIGCDCKGLVWGPARDLGLPEAAASWGAMSDYRQVGYAHTLRQGLRATLLRVQDWMLGDVLLLNQGGAAQHLAIYGGDDVLTAYVGAGRVKRVSTAGALRAWPLDSIWRFRSLHEAGEAV